MNLTRSTFRPLTQTIKNLLGFFFTWFAATLAIHLVTFGFVAVMHRKFQPELFQTDQKYKFLSLVCTTIATAFCAHIFISKQTVRNNFFTIRFHDFAFGFLWGFVSILAIVFLHSIFGFIDLSYSGFSSDIFFLLILYLLVAINEELLFRGLLFHRLNHLSNSWILTLTSLVFGLAHVGNDHFTWIGFSTIALSGLAMGFMYLHFGNISSCVAMHFSWNFFQGPIFGYAVSGHKGASLFSISYNNFSFPLTGGDFGAEGSVLLIMITLSGIFLFQKQKHSLRFLNKDL